MAQTTVYSKAGSNPNLGNLDPREQPDPDSPEKLEGTYLSSSSRRRGLLLIVQDVDLEVVVKAADSDCWVSGRVVGPRRLVLVMEGRAEKGLLDASTTAARFAAEHTSGIC